MNTIKIYFEESGRIADLRKDFPLYKGSYQNKLLNVYAPTSILEPDFSLEENGETVAEFVASTAVEISMVSIARDGTRRVSQKRYMRYLKTLTYQGKEYALYERKLPKEFTAYAGQGENAPKLEVNLVVIGQDPTVAGTPMILRTITTQECALDVQEAENLDGDEAIEPSELENVNAELNGVRQTLLRKQDKHDDALDTTDKTVVGAINYLARIPIEQEARISANEENIASNRAEIERLEAEKTMAEEYIGKDQGAALPTNDELNAFVQATAGRASKNGDVVIFVLEIEGETDKNYKYIYSIDGWNGYEIPALEPASNGSLGLIQGTYTIDNTNTLVDIAGGKIVALYVLDTSGTYRDIHEYANTMNTTIENIISGDVSVGLAVKALQDGLGNNIVDTYLTQNAGATKRYVRDYALPREFNDVYFITSDGYQLAVPTEPANGVQFSVTTNAVGDFRAFQIEKQNTADFELSSKNSSQNSIYISANRDCSVYFRLTTQTRKMGENWKDLSIELTESVDIVDGEIHKLTFDAYFTALGENVITVGDGDVIRQTLDIITHESEETVFDIYSNETYPSTYSMNVLAQRVTVTATGKVGELPFAPLTGTLGDNTIDFGLPSDFQLNDNQLVNFQLSYINNQPIPDNTNIQLSFEGETIRLVTPYNFESGACTFLMLNQVDHSFNAVTGTLLSFVGLLKQIGADWVVIVQMSKSGVVDGHDNPMPRTKFTGHNGVNVDMAEDAPDTFDIRLDNTITEAIEDNHTAIQTLNNKLYSEEVVDGEPIGDIPNLTNMLGETEDRVDQLENTRAIIIKDTQANLSNANDVIASGTFVYDTTRNVLKIGDGSTRYINLKKFSMAFDSDGFAQDSWETIAAISASGAAPEAYHIGDVKTINIGGVDYHGVIAGFNHDDLADGTGKAGITIMLEELFTTSYRMNSSNTNSGGWEATEMRTSTLPTILGQLPSDLQSVIKSVSKTTTSGSQSTTIQTTNDELFLFSEVEISGKVTSGYTAAGEGTQYQYWKGTANGGVKDGTVEAGRKKYKLGSSSASNWWLRSPYVSYSSSFCLYGADGSLYTNGADYAFGVCFGFCI